PVRVIVAAQEIKPQAKVLAAARGITWVEVDYDVLRGTAEPDLTLFGARLEYMPGRHDQACTRDASARGLVDTEFAAEHVADLAERGPRPQGIFHRIQE